ncbi:hypothetical protein [Achromobacter mucicolens]|uniref:hypothetical protein n=1 Tax=Achromobacter mucicolens TaxID=1389922 RepID=UPI0015816CD4|nr:hypothetical protein [Achromobacter mucicolens]
MEDQSPASDFVRVTEALSKNKNPPSAFWKVGFYFLGTYWILALWRCTPGFPFIAQPAVARRSDSVRNISFRLSG